MTKRPFLSAWLVILSCLSPTALTGQSSDNAQNYRACVNGYAACDRSKLTEGQRDEVRQAALRRNYNSCVNGYAACDQSKLTEFEKQSVATHKQSNSEQPTESPRYYTNSAGERVQSPTFSPTVPAGASAQCRDGSYSFSRNRRGTCSHHGGVAKWL